MLKSIFSTATWQQSQITITGTIINGVLGALFYILMARFLGPSDFGLLIISVATLTLIADIVDFGTNTGLVRHVSASLNNEKLKSFKFLKLGLEVKLLAWLLVLSLGIYLSPQIAQYLFNKPELTNSLELVMIGVGGALLLSFATSSLQAFQKYFTWSLVNILTNFFRLLMILILFFSGTLNLSSGLLAYILLPFFGFSIALLFLPFKEILKTKNELEISRQFFKYNMYVAIFTIIAAISSRLDTFITARLLSAGDVGVYGVANQMTQVFPQIVGALGVVVAPKFASFQNKEQMLTYFKKFQFLVLGLSTFGFLAIPVSFYLIPLVFGSQYSQAILPFIILVLAQLIFLISIPLHNSILFYFGEPQVFVWVAIGHFLIISFLGFELISKYGVSGAAVTVLIGMVFGFIAPLIWFLRRIRE